MIGKLLMVLWLLGSILLGSNDVLAEGTYARGNISKHKAAPLSVSKTISAYVNPYATIDFGTFTAPAHLTGAVHDVQYGSLEFTVVANCGIELLMSATSMNNWGNVETREHTHGTLTTLYDITTGNTTPQYKPAQDVLPWDHALDQESKDFILHYQVQDGAEVYSQHAGNYRAFVTVYVIALSY